MSFLDLCRNRYSLRRYADRPVPREAVARCLEAARLAPSACNSQPWRFIVTDHPDARDALAEAAFSGLYAMNAFAKKAPVLVTVVTERSVYAARLGGFLRGVQYALIDIGIACEHFVLQATEEGLGTCWYGWFDEKAVKQTLGLPRKARVDVMLSLGYAQQDETREKKRKALEEVTEFR